MLICFTPKGIIPPPLQRPFFQLSCDKSFSLLFAVPSPPREVKVVVKSPQSVIVNWMEPVPTNGAIERYHIYIR